MHISSSSPIDVVHLFPQLDKMLIELLQTLSPDQWKAQTIAREWKVKDVAAHLLDGNIRTLSMLRNNFYGEKFQGNTNEELIAFLNGLNADWVKAMKRVSPEMLIQLHMVTGKAYCEYYASLDPYSKAGFAVNWAGENESKNWMHIAREYTEKWLHQQQIRDAIGITGLMNRTFFYPFIDIFMMALPYTFRNTKAAENTIVQLTIPGDIGGTWNITMQNGEWESGKIQKDDPASEIILDADLSWRLFSKSVRAKEVKDNIIIKGNIVLGEIALQMVSVMA